MAELKPCTHCRRHVDVVEVVCPFCAASVALEPSAPSRLGRVSRAVAFAGAALATAACGGGKKAQPTTQQQPPAPADAGVEKTVDAEVRPPNMPYGAPPARRRLV